MRKSLLLYFSIMFSQDLFESSQLNTLTNWFQEPLGWTYPLEINIPDLTTPETGFPVCILLHGFGGNGNQLVYQYQNILNTQILIAPTGYMNSWNISNEPSKAPDVEMISDLVNQLQLFNNINSDKIRIIGFSNGAALANRIFIENYNSGIDIICSIVSQLSEAQYHNDNFYYPSNGTNGNQEFNGYNDIAIPLIGRKYLNIGNINDPIIPYFGGAAVGVNFLNSLNSIYLIAKSQGYQGDILSDEEGIEIDGSSIYEYNYLSNQVVHLKGNSGHNLNTYQQQYLVNYLESSPDYGDLNQDNLVNILDVVILVNYVLQNINQSIEYDLNQDDNINILDIILLINIILV